VAEGDSRQERRIDSAGRSRPAGARQASGGRDCASGAAALIEVEVRDGLGFGQVVGGRRVEIGVVRGTDVEEVRPASSCRSALP